MKLLSTGLRLSRLRDIIRLEKRIGIAYGRVLEGTTGVEAFVTQFKQSWGLGCVFDGLSCGQLFIDSYLAKLAEDIPEQSDP